MKKAERISFIGYSLPQTDLVMASKVESSLRGRDSHVDIVDIAPKNIAKRPSNLGGLAKGSNRLVRFSGKGAVEEFAEALCNETAQDVPASIAGLADLVNPIRREMALVTWSRNGSAVCHRVTHASTDSDGTLQLTRDPDVDYGAQPSEQEPKTLDIIKCADRATRIVAKTPQRQESVIVGYDAHHFDNPTVRHKLFLIAAGQLDDKGS
jgi:hypothetical protein